MSRIRAKQIDDKELPIEIHGELKILGGNPPNEFLLVDEGGQDSSVRIYKNEIRNGMIRRALDKLEKYIGGDQ